MIVPLVVRLSTGRSDVHVTRDVRDLSFRSTIPGGFASCNISLDRPLSLDPDEVQLYGDLFIYDGRNGEVVWQGRLEDPGRGSGPQGETWSIAAAGPSAHARDRQLPLIYIDRVLDGRWFRIGGENASAKGAGFQDGFGPDDDDQAAYQIAAPETSVVANGLHFGRWYRYIEEAGQKLARFSYDVIAGKIDTNWRTEAIVRDPSLGSGTLVFQTTFSTSRATKAAVVVTDFPNSRAELELRMLRANSGITVADDNTWTQMRDVIVRSLLLDATGAEITTGYTNDYVLASEVVKDLLGRLLDQFDGANATVTATTKQIDQLAYPDGATPERILADLMAIEPTFYWAAWEGDPARFEWKTWPTSVRYEATARGGFQSPASAAGLFNRVSLRWRDAYGVIRITVRTNTVAVLDDASLTREAFIDLADEFGSSSIADDVGDAFLTEHNQPPNAGTLTIREPIFDADRGRLVDPWEVRPGHLIRVRDVKPRVDALNPTDRDAVTVFRIVAVGYNAAENAATLELDSRPRELAGLLVAAEKRLERLRKR